MTDQEIEQDQKIIDQIEQVLCLYDQSKEYILAKKAEYDESVSVSKAYEMELKTLLEKKFISEHGITPEEIKASYKDRVSKLCGMCGTGHYVKVVEIGCKPTMWSKNLVEPRASHIYLLPENYKDAFPTDAEAQAFLYSGEYIWIDPETHVERWGN